MPHSAKSFRNQYFVAFRGNVSPKMNFATQRHHDNCLGDGTSPSRANEQWDANERGWGGFSRIGATAEGVWSHTFRSALILESALIRVLFSPEELYEDP
jgi:hypothetical protein